MNNLGKTAMEEKRNDEDGAGSRHGEENRRETGLTDRVGKRGLGGARLWGRRVRGTRRGEARWEGT